MNTSDLMNTDWAYTNETAIDLEATKFGETNARLTQSLLLARLTNKRKWTILAHNSQNLSKHLVLLHPLLP